MPVMRTFTWRRSPSDTQSGRAWATGGAPEAVLRQLVEHLGGHGSGVRAQQILLRLRGLPVVAVADGPVAARLVRRLHRLHVRLRHRGDGRHGRLCGGARRQESGPAASRTNTRCTSRIRNASADRPSAAQLLDASIVQSLENRITDRIIRSLFNSHRDQSVDLSISRDDAGP